MRLLAIALTIATASVGCGEDSDTATSSVPMISKAEFITQANAACEEARAGLTEKVSDFEQRRASGRPALGADVVHLVYLPTLEAQVWRIEELGIPHGEEERIDEMLNVRQLALDTVAVMPRVPSIAVAERHFVKADKLFRAYGLTSCAAGRNS